jgi:hypothetical protein
MHNHRCFPTIRWTIAFLAAVVTTSGPGQAQPRRVTESDLPRATGLSLQVEAAAGGVVLRRPQDVIAHVRSLPGIYAGATDPLLAVSFEASQWRRGPDSWVHERFEFQANAREANVVANRLCPAVLLDLPDATLRLKAAPAASAPNSRSRDQELPTLAGALPRYVAWPTGGKVVVRGVSDLGDAMPLELDEPWMLVWFGSDTAARGHAGIFDVETRSGPSKSDFGQRAFDSMDVPLLLRLEHRPSSLGLTSDQIVIRFADHVGKVATMPLFGRRVWLPDETEAWRDGLPEEVTDQCRRWSRWLRDFPLTVEETVVVSDSGNTISVLNQFQWLSFQDDWQTPPIKAAPVPPLLALVLESDLPVSLRVNDRDVRPVDGNLMDFAGKAAMIEGADAYEYRIADWRRLFTLDEQPAQAVPETQSLRDELERQVDSLVTAGHLRPLYLVHGGLGTRDSSWYWVGTPETAYALARAYPYLSRELQDRVRRYVATEWEHYPPLELDRRSYTDGAPREPYSIDGVGAGPPGPLMRDQTYRQRNFLFDLYRIERASAVIPGLPDTDSLQERATQLASELAAELDWAILGPRRLRQLNNASDARFTSLQGSAAYNAWLAGAIGLSRFAARHGWQDVEATASVLAVKLALARVAQARYVEQMHRMGLVRGECGDDHRSVVHIDQLCTIVRCGPITTISGQDQELPPFIDLVPEVGRLLAGHARAQCAVYLDYLDDAMPYWYLSEAPKQSATEHRLCPLWHQSGNVAAQAWILGKRDDEFRRYIDATRFRGDLFAIHNLATAIESYGSTRSLCNVRVDSSDVCLADSDRTFRLLAIALQVAPFQFRMSLSASLTVAALARAWDFGHP